MPKHICLCCGREFWGSANRVYCSPECAGAKKCLRCGKIHRHKRYGVVSDYCLECSGTTIEEWKNRKQTEPKNKPQTPMPVDKIYTTSAYCSICGRKTVNENGLCSDCQYKRGNVWVLSESEHWLPKFPEQPIIIQSGN